MQGTFLEASDEPHVSLRYALLNGSSLPPPAMRVRSAKAAAFEDDGWDGAEADLRETGLCLVQLDRTLDTLTLMRLASRLGHPIPETDVDVQSQVEHGVVLHLRSSFGPTELVALQPFSTGFLTLHSESSGQPAERQPRHIILHCLEPGRAEDAPQTVLVSMDAVVGRLSQESIDVLSRTCYDGGRGRPTILRRQGARWIISFRDFFRHSLSWSHGGGPVSGDAVRTALRELLAAMYAKEGASTVHWSRGLLVVIDNQRWLHGRTAGRQTMDELQRHLVRVRVRPASPGGELDHGSAKARRTEVTSTSTRDPIFSNPILSRYPPICMAEIEGEFHDRLGTAIDHPVESPVDERVLEVFARASNPDDGAELHRLWLGRVEAESGAASLRGQDADFWRSSIRHRTVTSEQVLHSQATVVLVKSLFNTFFRDELYGALSAQRQIVLSGGAVNEESFGLPTALKETLRYALDRDWYGYSDSRGREASRLAVAALESARIPGSGYTAENVVITLGATQSIAALADFAMHNIQTSAPALCAVPNYPPLVQSVARRHPVRLVSTPSSDGVTSLTELASALTTQTPFVLLQTASNPGGSSINESELERFILASSPSTLIVLDECHEWLGAGRRFSPARCRSNVIRVSSLSKEWSVPGMKVGWFLADPGLVQAYYEHASTSYGGPASLMYTLVEFLARFERWREAGQTSVGASEAGEFAGSYGIVRESLSRAYASYLAERTVREATLRSQRDATCRALQQARIAIQTPRCSINVLVRIPGSDDSYGAFRRLLRDTGVSVYPAALAFQLAGGSVRLTTSVPWPELREALLRLRRWAADHPSA